VIASTPRLTSHGEDARSHGLAKGGGRVARCRIALTLAGGEQRRIVERRSTHCQKAVSDAPGGVG
jgi:hypothetical protein